MSLITLAEWFVQGFAYVLLGTLMGASGYFTLRAIWRIIMGLG